jgi:hypothetical protein
MLDYSCVKQRHTRCGYLPRWLLQKAVEVATVYFRYPVRETDKLVGLNSEYRTGHIPVTKYCYCKVRASCLLQIFHSLTDSRSGMT